MNQGADCIKRYHYLGNPYMDAPTNKVYGLIYGEDVVGVVQFSEGHCHPSFVPIYFGVDSPTTGLWDITRLVVSPKHQGEHNITSWFLSRALKMLKPKYVVTMADNRMHDGTIYAAVGFDYYGLLKDRGVPGLEDVEFHVFTKSYDPSIKCVWEKIKFDKTDY